MNDAEIEWLNRLRDQEIAAFCDNSSGEKPDRPGWKILLDLGSEGMQHYSRIMELSAAIIAPTPSSWPTDKIWHQTLPQWFSDQTRTYTREEADALQSSTPRELWSTLPWDFGSWLDEIKDRQWRWYSHQFMNNQMEINLLILGWPALLDAFEYALRTTGASIISSERS
jgi:hypothetical protein